MVPKFSQVWTILLSIVAVGALTIPNVKVIETATQQQVDLPTICQEQCKKLVVYGTYAADFNAIEYAQRLKHYLPQLQEKGVLKNYLILNASPDAATKLSSTLDLPSEITILSDEFGAAGREFGCERGFRPEDDEMNPYLKLFAMLWGLGAWATLPSVIGGYIGNPMSPQPWIESSLAQGQIAGRWPNTALEVDSSSGKITQNKFSELPGVGGWGRRPLELATLRLQNMLGVSLKEWDDLKPSDEALKEGVLTQLGGCAVYGSDGEVLFEWRDAGICHVAKFEDILEKLEKSE